MVYMQGQSDIPLNPGQDILPSKEMINTGVVPTSDPLTRIAINCMYICTVLYVYMSKTF